MRRLATLLLCCSLLAADAAAQPAAQRRARALFGQAKAALARGRTLEALALFIGSLGHFEHDSTMLNIAQCYRLLHRPERAVEHYQRYLALARRRRPGGPVPYADEVAGYLEELGRVVTLTRQGRQLLDAGEPRAALRPLRQARATSPGTRLDLLLARAHRALGDLRLARQHALDARTRLREVLAHWMASHQREDLPHVDDIDRELSALDELLRGLEGAGRRAAGGTLVLLGLPPAARLSLDGGAWRPAKAGQPIEIPPGRHHLVVQARNHLPWEDWLELKPGQRMALPLDLEPQQRRCTACLVTGIAGIALAIAAEVTAIALTVHANELFTDDPDFDRLRIGVIVSHVAAGAFALTSGIGFYPHRRRSPARAAGERAAPSLPAPTPVVGLTFSF
jgi:tetratricopeptide (TPR) repeat protein